MSLFYTINGNVCTTQNVACIFNDPLNPLNLPPFTIRVRTSNGTPPVSSTGTATLVEGTTDVYDVVKNSTDWSQLLNSCWNVIEVLGANTTGVTNMKSMFDSCNLTTVPLFDTSSCTNMSAMFNSCYNLTTVPLFNTSSCTDISYMFINCSNLTTVPLFDTSSCTNMKGMFYYCTSLITAQLFDTSSCTDMSFMFCVCSSLTHVPLYDTSVCTNMSYMFSSCTKVESGAFDLYQRATSQAIPPVSYAYCFYNCGANTVQGAAELAQIPDDWKGYKY